MLNTTLLHSSPSYSPDINELSRRAALSRVSREYRLVCSEIDDLYLLIDEKCQRLQILLDSYAALGGAVSDLDSNGYGG